MYIFTSFDLEARKMKAGVGLKCSYCTPKTSSIKKIEPGEKFYWIEGKRNYSHFGRAFVPSSKWPKCKRKGIRPEDYFEPITYHQMCQECFVKLSGFFHDGEKRGVAEKWIFRANCHITYPQAMYEHHCICCKGKIKPGDHYLRRGNSAYVNNVCSDCQILLEPIMKN